MNIMAIGAELFFERPARNKSIAQLRADMKRKGDRLSVRFASVKDTPGNRGWLTHLIGIEKWGQQRLKVALGEPFIEEEYDGYRPSNDTPWPALTDIFRQTRAESITLAEQLERQPFDRKIKHNDFGDLTVRGWLKYLHFHASTTALLIR